MRSQGTEPFPKQCFPDQFVNVVCYTFVTSLKGHYITRFDIMLLKMPDFSLLRYLSFVYKDDVTEQTQVKSMHDKAAD